MAERIYSVSWVNAYLHNMVSQDFLLQGLSIKGEASNVKYHSSNHLYFTLKDEKAAISCIMFAGNRRGIKFKLEDGMKIVVKGTVDVWERDGKNQLYAKEITLEGAGDLYEKFEALKEELRDRGLFEEIYKRPIPKHIKTLGVVTAETGAAVRDIIDIAKRRDPGIQILLYPAIVQGNEAAESIVKGIRVLEETDAETIIVGRGGGSIEDLWAFNEEIVAQAIFNCTKPVISAVGHETDFTIADLVADLRAPTPSAAAELAVFEKERLISDLRQCEDELNRAIDDKFFGLQNAIRLYEAKLKAVSPLSMLDSQRMRLISLEDHLEQAIDDIIRDRKSRMAMMAERLDGLSPLKRMSAGFAFVEDKDGNIVKSVKRLKKGDDIRLTLSDGSIDANIISVSK